MLSKSLTSFPSSSTDCSSARSVRQHSRNWLYFWRKVVTSCCRFSIFSWRVDSVDLRSSVGGGAFFSTRGTQSAVPEEEPFEALSCRSAELCSQNSRSGTASTGGGGAKTAMRTSARVTEERFLRVARIIKQFSPQDRSMSMKLLHREVASKSCYLVVFVCGDFPAGISDVRQPVFKI